VLAAWDGNDGVRLAAALDAFRATLPKQRAPRRPGARRPPRQGTKQAAVLALLRRLGGASGPQIAAATGWAPHTVRGFLAALKTRGVAVRVHERVRQVGPGKDGAMGSYTIYRIAEPG
jgi:predicted ArsR family transcriptional regulator